MATFIRVVPILLLCACGTEAEPEPTPEDTSEESSGADWSELDEDTEDTDKEEGDADKDEYPACGDEVVDGASCEGGWEDTLCADEAGVFWWCEGGAWTSK